MPDNAAADDPADARARATHRRDGLRERVDAAGEDADDRERDGEVREFRHGTLQFLRVAHAMQDLHVLMFFIV
jgi:hypothetical protein